MREISQQNHSLLIFDEVITGFRLSLGGAQEYFHITPDLTTLGKIVGGGMPVGAYGGRREIMECVAPVGDVYQAGTLSGNPIAMTAGLSTLRILKQTPEIYQQLEKYGAKLASCFREVFGNAVCVNQIGSLLSVFFTAESVVNYETALTSDTEKYGRFFRYMLEEGINLAPSQFEAMFISAAHKEAELARTCDVIRGYLLK